MTTPTLSAPFVSIPDQVEADPFAIDEPTGRLMLLLGELDKAGLAGELTVARALLAKSREVASTQSDASTAYHATRNRLVTAVAAGDLSVAAAAAELAAADVRGAAGALTQGAVQALRSQAVAAVRADGGAVHDALARRMKAGVQRAVDAGRLLVDVKAVAKLLKLPPWREPGKPYHPADRHPWESSPPALPTVALDPAGDPAKVAAWAGASSALKQIRGLFEAADALHALWGGSSTLWAGEPDASQVHFVGKLAEQVQLAVYDQLGFKAGLHLSLRTPPRPPQRSITETVVAGIRYPAGWVGVGNQAPRGGPYGNGARPRS